MCGVVGIYSDDEDITPQLTYYSLFSLQHRGQESAGIASYNGDNIVVYKGMGLITQVFNEKLLKKLKGKVSIGHVRYSTTGESKIENAQPLFVKSKAGSLAIAHNGNLVNYWELRRELENGGRVFLTESDTEVIAHLLSTYLIDHDVPEALELLTEKLVGSYTLTILYNDTLIGYRDPYGFKPLCIGKGDFGYILASESCAIDSTDAEFIRDIRPGEAVIIKNGQPEFVRIRKEKRKSLCVFEYIYFARPDSIIDGRSVYKVRYNSGRLLAKESPVDADVVSPIPDSGITVSIGYSQESGIKFLETLIKNRYVGRTFIMPEQRIRELSVKIKMNTVKENIEGKRIVLVDDSIVRGTTSKKIVKMVKNAGAKEVHLRVGSPPIIAPCYFGIDMPTREELIASGRSIDEIKNLLEVDSLAYLSLKSLLKAINCSKNRLCLACLTSKYPVPVPGEELDEFAQISLSSQQR